MLVNRRVIASFVIAVIVIAGGVLLGRKYKSGNSAAGATQYKITKAATGEVKKTVSSSGTLQAWKTVDIKARAGGELTQLAVDVGSEVKKGQLLARIDPLDVRLSLNTAQADETSAKARESKAPPHTNCKSRKARLRFVTRRPLFLQREPVPKPPAPGLPPRGSNPNRSRNSREPRLPTPRPRMSRPSSSAKP